MNEPGEGDIRLAHLGMIVAGVDGAADFYRRLGLPAAGTHTFAQENIRMTFVPAGDMSIELMEPLVRAGPLYRFLAARGEGVHHLAFAVPNLDRALSRARAAGARLIDESPRPGAYGTKVAFIHPASTCGVLVELVERPPKPSTDTPR